jgi:hypothetical protein
MSLRRSWIFENVHCVILRRHDQRHDYCGCDGIRAPQARQVDGFRASVSNDFRQAGARMTQLPPVPDPGVASK